MIWSNLKRCGDPDKLWLDSTLKTWICSRCRSVLPGKMLRPVKLMSGFHLDGFTVIHGVRPLLFGTKLLDQIGSEVVRKNLKTSKVIGIDNSIIPELKAVQFKKEITLRSYARHSSRFCENCGKYLYTPCSFGKRFILDRELSKSFDLYFCFGGFICTEDILSKIVEQKIKGLKFYEVPTKTNEETMKIEMGLSRK